MNKKFIFSFQLIAELSQGVESFNGEGLSSGIYLYNINAVSINGKQNFQATKKMILVK